MAKRTKEPVEDPPWLIKMKGRYSTVDGKKFQHHGDCYCYACGICNCGLMHDLNYHAHGNLEIYPDFWDEWVHGRQQFENLQDLQRKRGGLQGRLPREKK